MSVKSKTIHDGNIAIIEIRGSLIGDEETDQFRENVSDFIEQGNKNLIVGLQKVNYMNSTGLGALISAYSSYKKIGGEVKLIGINQNVQNLLAITRLIEVFDVYDSLDEAVESFSKLKLK